MNSSSVRFWDGFYRDDNLNVGEISYKNKLELTKERIINKGLKRANKYNELHKFRFYDIGDLVLVKSINLSNKRKKLTAKYMHIYKGPYKIISKNGKFTYILADLKGKIRGSFHSSNFKPYYGRKTHIGDDAEDDDQGKEESSSRDRPVATRNSKLKSGS